MAGEWFTAYAKQILVHTLHSSRIGILDNLSAHKSVAARKVIKATGGCMLFIPRYRPDFNPTENTFSKFMSILQKAAARTLPELWDSTRNTLLRLLQSTA